VGATAGHPDVQWEHGVMLAPQRPMTRVGRAVEKGETRGFMKVVVDAGTKQPPFSGPAVTRQFMAFSTPSMPG
jgi:hypothetical protein